MRRRNELMRQSGFITAQQAAELSGVTVQTIHRMVRDGRVEGKQIAGRAWYVKAEALAAVYEGVPSIRDAILAAVYTPPSSVPPAPAQEGAQ